MQKIKLKSSTKVKSTKDKLIKFKKYLWIKFISTKVEITKDLKPKEKYTYRKRAAGNF